MMTVLHICLSDGWGGLEQYPLSLAVPSQERGVRLCYLGLEDSRFSQEAAARGLTLFTLPSRSAAFLQLHRLLRWIREQCVEVVHFHKSSDLRLLIALAPCLPAARFFFTEHMNVQRPKRSFYHRWVYKRLHRVFAISDYTRANNLRALPVDDQQLVRLYLGIDLQRFCPSLEAEERASLRASLGLAEQTVAICLPGRISPGKGHAVFVEAVLELGRRLGLRPSLCAFIVGGLQATEGSDEALVEQLQSRIRAHQAESLFHFTGYTPEVHRLLQAMDVVCIPSEKEAFGLTVIESLALGLPVVASDSGGIPEILGSGGEYGLLAAPHDPAAFASALERLALSKALREELGARGIQRAKSSFDLTHHVERLLEFYRS